VGNREFELAVEQLVIALGQSEQTGVVFFMIHFVPNCRLTLDGLMKTN